MKTRYIIGGGVGVVLLLAFIAILSNRYTGMRSTGDQWQTDQTASSPLGQTIAVGHVSAVTGSAWAVTSTGDKRDLEDQASVFLNETIHTGADARMQITLNDGSTLNQGKESEIVIDAFLYDPEVASRNKCHVRVLAGIFRTVTDGITSLNPDHFKVKTRMATIGIRGCEVGVDMTSEGESVYIIGLPEGHTIRVETDKAVSTEAYSITPNKS